MSSFVYWVFGFFCIAAMAVGIMAASSQTAALDLKNQTDSFGNAHTAQENATADTINTVGAGGAKISSGLVILAGVVCALIIVVGFLLYNKFAPAFGSRR